MAKLTPENNRVKSHRVNSKIGTGTGITECIVFIASIVIMAMVVFLIAYCIKESM